MIHPMTDIHQHLLWGIDDGAETKNVMQAMLLEADRQGICTVAATAHAQPGIHPFDMGLYQQRLSEAKAFCEAQQLRVNVIPGAEIAWTWQTVSALRRGVVPTLGDTDYVLVELWRDISWQAAKEAVNQLIRAGFCPVLAHVERYLAFQLSPRTAMRLSNETGALLQVNADALLHPRGFLERRFVRTLLREQSIDVVASDAHNCKERPINMKDACEWLAGHTDEAYARHLTNFGGVFP